MRSLLQYFVCVLSGQVFDVGVEVSFGVGVCVCVGGVSFAFVQQVEYIEIKTRISFAVLKWFTGRIYGNKN